MGGVARFAALGAAGLALATAAEPAEARGGGRDPTFWMRSHESFMVQRYPGDQAFHTGTVRIHGPDEGPYVERCVWTAEGAFYGLPLGLTQRCYRYTLENTPE